MKICTRCSVEKDESEFYLLYGKPRTWCKKCSNAYDRERLASDPALREKRKATTKAWKAAHPDSAEKRPPATRKRKLDVELNYLYGISLAEYERMLAEQEGKCWICRRQPEKKLCVDHDHVSGRVRGLLCYGCNTGIGQLGDSTEMLLRAVEYLQRAGVAVSVPQATVA